MIGTQCRALSGLDVEQGGAGAGQRARRASARAPGVEPDPREPPGDSDDPAPARRDSDSGSLNGTGPILTGPSGFIRAHPSLSESIRDRPSLRVTWPSESEPAVRVFLGRPSLFWAAGRDRRLYQAGPVEMLSLPPSLPPPYLILSAGPP